MDLGFDGRVAIVTGAGGGLGREHALLLAERGARLIVNDIGGSVTGQGSSAGPAQQVVDEIAGNGGEAVADTHSVRDASDAAAIVQSAVDHFGRVDIVVNNAGILRDKSFGKMSEDDMRAVLDVHLGGAFNVTRAAWPHMQEQQYGRVVSTSSAAGIFGNFGQANYGAAKSAIVGLSNVLAIEGAKYNIHSNVLAPVARTRMTEATLGERLVDRVDARLVAPLVAWLAHEECLATGHLYTVGGGRVARLFVAMSKGWTRTDGELSVEDVRDHFGEIEDSAHLSVAESMRDDLRALVHALNEA
jgi:NAD(P)-dependent dehydrogenase (short-subunit alcohol dehydrogenase family)